MFDDLPRHTLIRLKSGGVFLIKCKIYEWHGMKKVPAYLGHRYMNDTRVDYEPWTCYIGDIDSVMENP
jgi:hypothetical protein